MSVGIKAFLYKDWETDPVEIRRFSVDRDVATCYDYMTQKLCQIFPTLCVDRIQMYWEDSDKDRIAISCDADIAEALKQSEGAVLRILVGAKQPPSPDDELDARRETDVTWQRPSTAYVPPEVPPYRGGLTCDGCGGPLYGVFYKYQTCPQYSLCSKCEGEGVHGFHTLLRADNPLPNLCEQGGGYSYAPHSDYYPNSAECSTQGNVARQGSEQQQSTGYLSIGKIFNTYVVEPLVGKIGAFSSNVQDSWRQPREACGDSSGEDNKEENEGSRSLTLNEQLTLGRFLSLGYDDENGWLTDLVRAKKGNFDEVNDALLP